MTIKKSQGQSMKHIAVDLQSRNLFSHRHEYVALSRVVKKIVNRVYKQILFAVGKMETTLNPTENQHPPSLRQNKFLDSSEVLTLGHLSTCFQQRDEICDSHDFFCTLPTPHLLTVICSESFGELDSRAC